MNRTIIYISATCFAFTFSSIFYYLFRMFNIFPPLTERMTAYLFIISTMITLLIFLSHQLPVEQPWLIHLIELGCVIVVLLIAGAAFKVYPFHSFYIVTVTVCGLLAYAFVNTMIYMNNKGAEREINKVISNTRSDANA